MLSDENTDRFHTRKHPRLPHYDYSAPNFYFVTICTKDMQQLFGTVGSPNWRGQIAKKGLTLTPAHFTDVRIDKSVIMPNHIHAIIVLQGENTSLSTVIGQYKSYVSRKIHEKEPGCMVWQASFHDHIIRNQQSYEKIWLYIESNLQNWEKDCFFSEDTQP